MTNYSGWPPGLSTTSFSSRLSPTSPHMTIRILQTYQTLAPSTGKGLILILALLWVRSCASNPLLVLVCRGWKPNTTFPKVP